MGRRALVLFALMSIIWGIPYLFIRIAVDEISPAVLVLGRTAIAAAILLPIALVRTDLRVVLARWRWVAAFAAVEIAIPWVALGSAEQHLSSSLAGLLIAGVPLVGAVIALSTGGTDRFGAAGVTGMLCGVVGVAFIVGTDVAASDTTALLQIGVVVVGYALGPAILARRLQGLPTIGIMAVSLTLVAILYTPIAATQWPAAMPSANALIAVVVLATVCTAAAFLLFGALIDAVGPVRATVDHLHQSGRSCRVGRARLAGDVHAADGHRVRARHRGFAARDSAVSSRRARAQAGGRVSAKAVSGVVPGAAGSVRVILEIGKSRKVVAAAMDWPGLDRGGNSEDEALAKLSAYLPRYAAVAERAGLRGEFSLARGGGLAIVERVPGSSSTDFWGIAHVPSQIEREVLAAADLERRLGLLQACWAHFDDIAAHVSEQLKPGSRSGGRSREEIIRHVIHNEPGQFSRKIEVRTPIEVVRTPAGLVAHRQAYLEAIRAYNSLGKPARTWPIQFLIRRTAHHVMDHAWELEDRDLTTKG